MRIRVQDISETVKEIEFAEPVSELNPLLEHGPVRDFCFVKPAEVRINHYRAGQDLFISGLVSASVVGQCARCIESYTFDFEERFSFALVPRARGTGDEERAVEDAQLSFYDGEEIDLSPLVREQLVLGLPTQPLCQEDCRGLCGTCGANLNTETCTCQQEAGDPRLAVLRSLKVRSGG